MKLRDTPEWGSSQDFLPPEIGFCFDYSISALDTFSGCPKQWPQPVSSEDILR